MSTPDPKPVAAVAFIDALALLEEDRRHGFNDDCYAKLASHVFNVPYADVQNRNDAAALPDADYRARLEWMRTSVKRRAFGSLYGDGGTSVGAMLGEIGHAPRHTPQLVFTMVWRHFSKPGAALGRNGIVKNGLGVCAYRTTHGDSCAVGCLLTEEEALMPPWSDNVIVANMDIAQLPERLRRYDVYALLKHMQGRHDDASGVEQFLERLRDIAKKCSFDIPSDDEGAGACPTPS